jgi:hypothetical protein
MNNNEATQLVSKLSMAYSNTAIAKSKDVVNFYLQRFEKLDFNTLATTIDLLVDSSSTLPKISDIMDLYKSEYRKYEDCKKAFDIKCEICDSKGFILDRQILDRNNEGKGKEYIYALHCSCELGNKYSNDMYSIESKYNTADIIAKRRKQSNKPNKDEVIAKVKAMLGGKL